MIDCRWMGMAAVAATVAQFALAHDWENLAVNSRNRLPPRTYSMPLADEKDALTDALEPETPWKASLNGTWRYAWAGNPELRERDFWKVGFDDSKWFTIDVPSCVEMRGFGSPGYTNIRYPHANLSHPTNALFATIRDRQSGKHDYNPVSSYRRNFKIPESWRGRRVILRFDGVYSAYYVWVNGKAVGYAEDSKLPSEFDITEAISIGQNGAGDGENVLAVEVYRWCDGSYLEDQDMTRFSGIFRDVTLWSMPKDGIWDFAVRTTPVGGYERWKIEVEGVAGASASLYDADGRKVCNLDSAPASDTCAATLAAQAWSAEKPRLYTLVVRKGEDIRMKRVGFKEQKIVDGVLLVNGNPIKLKGVNRHETSPTRGRSVTLDDMIRDVTLMKRYNVNTVRTSHYPNHHLWYDLCDRYGIYLVAEADVEGHEPGYEEKGLGNFREFDHTIIERNERHAVFYRNNPSVTIWSMGNETGTGDGFRKAIAAVKGIDPTRPVHWERGNPDADIDSTMYAPVDWLEQRGEFGDGTRDAIVHERKINPDWAHTRGKCFFMCEYAHAMGNAIGNFQEYWDVFYRHPSLAGGCIWDWVDQAVWKETDKIDPKTGKRERYLSYGGDFDEEPNDGPFNCNGVVDPFRHVTAKLVEVGHVHRNLVVVRSDDSGDNGFATVFELWNRFGFTRADEFLGAWKLRENGVVVAESAFEPPALEPLSRCRFTVPGLAEALAKTASGAELFVDFEFTTKKDAPWAKKGWIVARDQVALRQCGNMKVWNCENAEMAKSGKASIKEGDETVTVECGGTKAVFCRKSGTLCELTMGGKTVLKDPDEGLTAGPRLTCLRAFVDNDIWLRQKVYNSGLTQLRYHARPIRVAGDVVKTVIEVTGSKSAGFTHEATWTFAADGSLAVSNAVTPHGTMPVALPRLGLSLKISKSLDRVKYYGRGPRENYIDRWTGSFLGVWSAAVAELEEFYVRPQDNGYRGDVRWVEFTGKDGTGVRFAASEPLFVQALRYGREDMEFARQRNGEKRHRTPIAEDPWINLNLDVRQLGLGGNSCGPKPLGKYVFPIEQTVWTLKIAPVQ